MSAEWKELPRLAAYKSLFDAEDSPLVIEARRCRKLLEGEETDLHAIGMARGFLRLLSQIAPSHLERLIEAESEGSKKDPLRKPGEPAYRRQTRSR